MFSPNPTLQDIFLTPLFEEPLVPIGADPTPAETAALAAALEGYAKRSSPDDFSSLTGFLETYPDSHWNASLLTNLGLEYFNTGHYSKTLEVWSQAWQLAGAATDLKGKAVADRAVGELAYMYARLGRMTELDTLLKSIEDRAFSGPATERITGAREGLWSMLNHPEIAFCCGPLALHRIKLSVDPESPETEVIRASASTQEGFSLQQVTELSQKLGLNFRMAFRGENAAFVVPSVVHLKVDHYAALIRQEGDRYLLQDPTFGKDVWVTSAALEAETSGYFLIPPGDLARGWRAVEAQEGERVWGKGLTDTSDDKPHGRCDPQSPGGGGCRRPQEDKCKGMAVPKVHLMLVSLNITDEPVGYSPPVGPAVRFTVRYNQREAKQVTTFPYSNLGPKWTFDWLSYITDNPSSPLDNVGYYMMGGGTRTFTGVDSVTNTYAFQQYDQTKLTRTSPDSYVMLSPDGTRKVFSQSDGSTSTSTSRRIFLTKLIDPYGNAVSLTYDAKLRVTAITDAIGQTTTVSYELPADDPADEFKITKVTDPFGRSAIFDYDEPSNRLIKITDVAGITSQFTYDDEGGDPDFIRKLTTPYGDTTFTKESVSGNTRSLETVYPDGNRDRVEYNQSTNLGIPDLDPLHPGSVPPQSVPGGMATRNEYLYYRNTYYWDTMACAYAYGDYTKAKIYHWLHTTENVHVTAGILESVKEPLEGRIWYDYAGQSSGPIFAGTSNKPTHVGRVLDDGSTQLYTYEYNGFGNVTKMIDPVGRTFSYTYAENGIDLLEVRQTRAGQSQLLSKKTYNAQHLPLTAKDAAGQTTTYTYNARGQMLTEINAKGEKTTYHYRAADGYRESMEGPLPGADDTTAWTYDPVGRVRTRTDESGYTLTFDYDALDRLTKITFPDGTFNQYIYTRLDRKLIRDRAGRQTTFEYNGVRQVTKRTDPLNRATLFQWCKCGDLKSLTDPMGRTTTWRHDIQGRVKCKEYADGSKITYLHEKTTGRLRQRIDEKLQVTQYNYNPDDKISGISYTNATVATPSVAFTYDANYSRLSSMTDGTGTTHYRYIPIAPVPSLGAAQLASVEGPLPDDTITFEYDELGRRVSTAINGVASTLILDAAGRMKIATNALGTFNYTYDGSSSRIAFVTSPNGATAEFDYEDNLLDQLLKRMTHKVGATPISEFLYGYDVPTGQITSWSRQEGIQIPSIFGLAYDSVDQLKSASVSEGGNVVKTFGYSYDPANNRLTEEVDATTRAFSYNALNELTSVEDDVVPEATYQWDAEQRLVSVTSGNQETLFTYDGLGRHVGIRQLVNGAEVSDRRFVWCDNDICEERTPDGLVSKRFFHQGMKVESGATAGAYIYSRDHLGSIRELTDSGGNVRARYTYDPVGRRTLLTGDVDTDFGFAGMFWTPEASLNLTWFRAYDPATGRWLSRDPLKDAEVDVGVNLFTYVHNNPVNLRDPLGLCCEPEWDRMWGAGRDLELALRNAYAITTAASVGVIAACALTGGAACVAALAAYAASEAALINDIERTKNALLVATNVYLDCVRTRCRKCV
jgi:RHS repeat-associated protein